MTDKAIQRAAPLLETYDPNWAARHATCLRELDRLQEELESARDDAQLRKTLSRLTAEAYRQTLDAFHAQFRTAPDYAAWCLEKIEEKARRERKPFILTTLPDNATVPQITAWHNQAIEMLNEQDCRLLPVGQLDSVMGFRAELPPNTQRATFHLSYVGNSNIPAEARCTVEQTPKTALVCLHHVIGSRGTSPTQFIAPLASGIRQQFLPHIAPQELTFFIHVPAALGVRGEQFSRVDMDWSGKQGFTKPNWTHFEQIPPAIRDAETKPYDQPPEPPKSGLGALVKAVRSKNPTWHLQRKLGGATQG